MRAWKASTAAQIPRMAAAPQNDKPAHTQHNILDSSVVRLVGGLQLETVGAGQALMRLSANEEVMLDLLAMRTPVPRIIVSYSH